MTTQIIEKNGRKVFAMVPYKQFLRMQQKLEDYEDLRILRKAKADPRNRRSRPLSEYMRERGIV
jgi:hypothetical protein